MSGHLRPEHPVQLENGWRKNQQKGELWQNCQPLLTELWFNGSRLTLGLRKRGIHLWIAVTPRFPSARKVPKPLL